MCHNHEVECEQASLHSDLTLHSKKNTFKEMPQILEDFRFVDKCKPQ